MANLKGCLNEEIFFQKIHAKREEALNNGRVLNREIQ